MKNKIKRRIYTKKLLPQKQRQYTLEGTNEQRHNSKYHDQRHGTPMEKKEHFTHPLANMHLEICAIS